MTRFLLHSLRHYWRTNAAVVAGVAASVAVLAGALLVGQSVRASLRDLLTERIGATDYVVSADRFFGETLARRLEDAAAPKARNRTCPMITLKGVLLPEGSNRRAQDVTVYGVDERFWAFHGIPTPSGLRDRATVLGSPLAAQLAVKPGDVVLLRIGSRQDVPGETLFGRREDATRTIRLTTAAVARPAQLGEFDLRPGQATSFSMFVSLPWLQRQLAQPGRVNVLLVSSQAGGDEAERLRAALRTQLTASDVGVRLRPLESARAVSVESVRILLDEGMHAAARDAAAKTGSSVSGVFAYLANSIRARGREIPYSVLAAADLGQGALNDVKVVSGRPMSPALPDASRAIWLNDWAARDLGAAVGEPIDVEFYRWEDAGGLVTRSARFELVGVVSIGGDVDASLAPEVPGVTAARTLRAWDPPFPLDLRRIRPRDEAYWERYRGTPKAFVTLATGQALWGDRFGRLTAVRVATPSPSFAAELDRRIDPAAAGFTAAATRRDGLDASRGAVDLGEYFLYFSAFLIVAALVLVASFFKLGVERRVRELGVLRAMGFPAGTVQRLFLAEGAMLLAVGGLVGAVGAVAWGGALVAGLRTWWVGAVGTERVSLHVSWTALAVGIGAGAAASFGTLAWTIHCFSRRSPRALLAGDLQPRGTGTRRARVLAGVVAASSAGALAVLLGSATGALPSLEGFFGAGALLLVATVSLAAVLLRRAHPRPITGRGWRAIARLALRGAAHRPARSLVPVVLIASATFVIVSVDAFRKGAQDEWDRRSGTGGYALVATSAAAVLSDPATATGRDLLGIDVAELPGLAGATFASFRERTGDDASCLNLYAPRVPTILGAPRGFLDEGRFSFAASSAGRGGSRVSAGGNPWRLLDREPADGVVPVIADANSLEYSLHLAVGGETRIVAGNGASVRLRVVAALEDSILQGALVMSEANFLRLFPREEGYRFFLVDVPRSLAATILRPLSERLAESGLRVEPSRERLARYHRVENTYLSTFQSLGALGLILGTAGLLAVLLRNVLERRSELALLRATGYRAATLGAMVVAENLLLLVVGLGCGTVSALVAIAPALAARGGILPFPTIGLLVAAVTAAGLLSSLAGSLAVLRSPLVAALRSE